MKKSILFILHLSALTVLFGQNIRPVQFSWGAETLPQNYEALKKQPSVSSGEVVNGKFLRYIQFEQTLNSNGRQLLASLGIEMIGYVYPATYLLCLPEEIEFESLEPLAPVSIVPLKPEWKMDKSLREPPYGEWAVHGDLLDINIQASKQVGISEAAELCRKNGMQVLFEGNQNGFLQVRVLRDKIVEIAALPFIQFMELAPPPGEKEDTKGRSLHRANTIDNDHALGNKYNGRGVKTLVRDDGQLGPHIDFHGRLFNHSETPAGLGTHGDGVGGIIGGAGNLDPNMKGMASGADVHVVDYINNFQDETLPLHFSEGVTITNSSYSDGCNQGYTLATSTVDSQIYHHPTLMHVFSAGNSNGANCNYGAGTQWGNITGGHKMAKNAIATANLLPDALLDPTSSRGPAYDGRLKPDISANGNSQNSTDPNNAYQVFGGTSAAAPGVAGCLAQLTQAYKEINSEDAPSVLLKGLLLNSANELGNKGPDFKYGWGHINAWKALNLIQKHSYVKGQVDHANSSTHTVAIPLGVVEAKVMLIWAEPHAIPGAAKALINDLDIQVRNTDGDVFLPWKLNPTPDPLTLDLPSGKGRDSLNNVEQVSIEKPSPGTYQVTINGFDVPLGPQSYYVIWEFITEDIKMTYPAGGEGFVPGTKEMIRWDAYDVTESFGLEYSTNGGASFDPLTVLNPTARQYEWTVPLMVNGNVKLRLTRGTFSDTTDYAFSIAPVPQNIVISKVCPDSITVSWSEVNDTLSYDLYLLGSKYMEIKGRFDSATATVPINNPGEEQWASARVAHADGTAGQRAIAVGWPGGLKNCTQNFDLALKNILSPRESFTFSCSSGAGDNSVSVELKNEGQQNISGATIHYQFGNLPVVTETLPDLQVGESVDFTFQTPFSNLAGGSKLLKIWTAYLADSAPFNDTISLNINILDKVITGDFVEDFESSTNLPQGWAIVNPDNWFTWSPSNIFTGLRGINGEPSRTFFVNHYDYEEDQFQEDYLYVAPVDLSTIDQPTLTFDVSHRNFGTDYLEELRVELFPNCNLTNAPIVLLDVKDPELSTTASGSGVFIPTSSNQWRRYSIDLGNYANQTAVIRFVSVNAYGNNTYIDNIGVKKYEAPSIPIAEIVNPFDTLCRLDTVQFLAASLSQEAVYTWAFGTGASPVTATGKGPHTVVYLSAGLKTVRLIASNPYGADTTFNSIVVRAFPTANFTVSTNNLNATFNNTSLNSDYFLWDFGDGSTSTEKNPVHTYSQSGTYPVKLSSSNLCRANEKIIDVTVTGSSGLKEIEEELQVNILPNPTSGNFVVKVVNAQSKVAKFNLLDAQGRLVLATEKQLKQGDNFVPFEGLKLAKGVYQLQLLTENGTKSYSIVVL